MVGKINLSLIYVIPIALIFLIYVKSRVRRDRKRSSICCFTPMPKRAAVAITGAIARSLELR